MNEVLPSSVMRQQIEQGLGIPRELYLSAELFDREIESVFNRSWLYAGHESQLGTEPGAYLTVESGPESVIVVRTPDGRIAAHHNVCRHRGARLVEPGCGSVRRLVCPYHQWTYRTDGTLQGAPHMPAGFDRSGYSLASVHVAAWQGLIFVNLADRPPRTLADLLDTGAELIAPFDLTSARVAHTVTYDVAANWKLVWENAQECYHCTANHPEFMRAVDIRALNSPEWQSGEIHPSDDRLVQSARFPLRAGATSLTMDGRPASTKPLGEFREEREPYTAAIHMKPTFLMGICPDYAVVLSDRPLSVDRTEVTMSWLVSGDAKEGEDYDLDNLIKVWDQTNRQDWALCERTQLGVRSRFFVPGPLSGDEGSVAGFHRAYARLLDEAGM